MTRIIVPLACSGLMILSTFDTLSTCTGYNHCGTPCVSAMTFFVPAPVLLVLPFAGLLWAKRLTGEEVVARGAITCAAATWLAAFVFLWLKSWLMTL